MLLFHVEHDKDYLERGESEFIREASVYQNREIHLAMKRCHKSEIEIGPNLAMKGGVNGHF